MQMIFRSIFNSILNSKNILLFSLHHYIYILKLLSHYALIENCENYVGKLTKRVISFNSMYFILHEYWILVSFSLQFLVWRYYQSSNKSTIFSVFKVRISNTIVRYEAFKVEVEIKETTFSFLFVDRLFSPSPLFWHIYGTG